MNQLRTWAAQWGDLASVAGLMVTILGFVIAIYGIWRSKTASEHARQAATAVRDSLAQHGAIADLSSAMGIMGGDKALSAAKCLGRASRQVLHEIHEMARRKALRVDDALDSLLESLKAE